MSDPVFYVGAALQKDSKAFTGYVPAKFLTLNGKPVVDPVPGGSQRAYIYADGSDKYKTMGEVANPNNYLIVPASYTEQQARAFAAEIGGTVGLGPVGQALASNRMKNAFWPNGSQDLQRHPQWGIPEDSFVPAFTGGASYHLGSVTRWAGLPETLSEIGGGIPHWFDRPAVESQFPGLSQRNYEDISKGFSDADVARKVTMAMNDFGYNHQAQYPTGQIGDGNGNGVGDWRFALAGVDPVNPKQPVPPLQTDSKPAPRLVRLNRKTSPASEFGTEKPASSVIPSDNRSFSSDRFGNWGSASAGIAPPIAPDRPASFDDRFGNWGSVPAGDTGNPSSAAVRAPQNYKRSAAPGDPGSASVRGVAPAIPNLPDKESAFGGRMENASDTPRPDAYPMLRRVSSAFPGITSRDLDQPPAERTQLLGIFSGKPMSFSPFSLPLGGLRSGEPGDGNLFDFLAGLALRNPPPAPLPQDDQLSEDLAQPWFVQARR